MYQKQTAATFTEGPVKGHLLNQAIPMMWGLLAVLSTGFVDTIFIGQLGPVPLAAMGFCIPVAAIISSIAFGIGAGISSVISRSVGRGDTHKVQVHTSSALLLALFTGLLVCIIGYITINPLFGLMGADTQTMVYIFQYMSVWYLGAFLIVIPMAGNSALRSIGDSKNASRVMIAVSVINIALDPILIFGYGFIPALGVYGAAIATVIAYAIAFLMELYLLEYKKGLLTWKLTWQEFKASCNDILHIGFPAILINLLSPLSIFITTTMLASYDDKIVGGFNVAARIETISLLMMFALASILTPFIGQNLGAHKYDRVQEAIKISIKFSFVMGMGLTFILFLFGPFVVTLFTDDGLTIEAANWYLYIIPISYASYGIIMYASNLAHGSAKPKPSFWFSSSRLILVFIPLAFLGNALFGYIGIYIASMLSNIIVSIAAIIWIYCEFQTHPKLDPQRA